MLSVAVRARVVASLLLYVLLYGLDTYASRQLGQTAAGHAGSTGIASSCRGQGDTQTVSAGIACTCLLLCAGVRQRLGRPYALSVK
jgi:hypothetical protein